jgi:hypothetical protein
MGQKMKEKKKGELGYLFLLISFLPQGSSQGLTSILVCLCLVMGYFGWRASYST